MRLPCGGNGRLSAGAAPLPVRRQAFTLVEMMVAIAVFLLMMAVIAGVMSQTRSTVHAASANIDLYQAARLGFDEIAQTLSHATLNTYWDYDNAAAPTNYVRKSDLQFLVSRQADSLGVFFEAPRAYSANAGYNQTTGLLNAIGYYVEYGNDTPFRPAHVATVRWRYRLMEALQPTESLAVFSTPGSTWTDAVKALEWPLADNVIALILWPRLSSRDDATGTKISTDYTYDSRGSVSLQLSQLPPAVQVTLVAISESSALRLNMGSTPPAAIEGALLGKFQDATQYATDLAALEGALDAARVEYREFTTSVPIRESKWSGLP